MQLSGGGVAEHASKHGCLKKLHDMLKEPLKNGELQALSVGIFLVLPPLGILNLSGVLVLFFMQSVLQRPN